MNPLSAQFRVGALVLSVAALIAYMTMKVSEDPSSMGRAREAWFLMKDASGLVKNSNVRMAGIPIGIIKDIQLQDAQAHVLLSLRGDVPLTVSSKVEVRANGILGDKHVELIPGNQNDPTLPDGAQIMSVEDRGSLDAMMGEISKVTSSLSGVADALTAATTGNGDGTQPLGRIVRNIEKLTADLANLADQKKDKLAQVIDNIHNITETLDDYVSDDSPEGLKAAIKNATASLSRIDRSLRNVEEITDKINNGEGTIGRLVNDEATVEEINKAVAGVNQYLDIGNKLETSLDFHSYVLTNPGLAKSFVSIRLQPGPDRFYEVGVVDDPKGVVDKVSTSTTGSGLDREITETKRYYNKVKFSALFAKNFYNLTIRGGLMENAAGVGVDYHLFKKQLKMSLDALNFSDLDLRATAQYNFFKGLYLIGGASDILSRSGEFSSFVGAGVFITNDDLKLLVSKVPF